MPTDAKIDGKTALEAWPASSRIDGYRALERSLRLPGAIKPPLNGSQAALSTLPYCALQGVVPSFDLFEALGSVGQASLLLLTGLIYWLQFICAALI